MRAHLTLQRQTRQADEAVSYTHLKHTTRHVEIFPVAGGYCADTPGFASFDVEQMPPIPKEELQFAFPEFEPYIGSCRFDDCAHIKEPDCAVREALANGSISASRYESYCRLYEISAQYKELSLIHIFTDKLPGSVVSAGKEWLEIACGSGRTVMITELQAPGKKRMSARDYLIGHPVDVS